MATLTRPQTHFVGRHRVGAATVSTVLLRYTDGTSHYETAVLTATSARIVATYATRPEAVAGHRQAVADLRG